MSMNRLVVMGIAVTMMALGGSAQAAAKRVVVVGGGVGGATAAALADQIRGAKKPLKVVGHKKPASETVPQSSLLPTSLPQFPDDYQIDDDSLDED